MPNLYNILRSNETKTKSESAQRERFEQFKGLRRQEREKTCSTILNDVYANATLDNENLTIKREVFEKIINETIKGDNNG